MTMKVAMRCFVASRETTCGQRVAFFWCDDVIFRLRPHAMSPLRYSYSLEDTFSPNLRRLTQIHLHQTSWFPDKVSRWLRRWPAFSSLRQRHSDGCPVNTGVDVHGAPWMNGTNFDLSLIYAAIRSRTLYYQTAAKLMMIPPAVPFCHVSLKH